MNKMIAFTMALVVILASASALGDSHDPIIGAWYADSTDGTTHIISVYVFDAAGYVTIMMLDFEPTGYKKNASVEPFTAGKWKRIKDNVYKISSSSSTYYTRADIYLDGDRLYIPVHNGEYWALRRMELFNNDIYTDAQIKQKFAK